MTKEEKQAWRNAAIRVGEELSSVGPDGYYDMNAWQWLDWAMENVKKAHPEQYPQIAINPEIVGYVAPQRTWVGLTDEEMMDAIYVDDTPMERGRRVEAKLRSKNNEQ